MAIAVARVVTLFGVLIGTVFFRADCFLATIALMRLNQGYERSVTSLA